MYPAALKDLSADGVVIFSKLETAVCSEPVSIGLDLFLRSSMTPMMLEDLVPGGIQKTLDGSLE